MKKWWSELMRSTPDVTFIIFLWCCCLVVLGCYGIALLLT
jgi:hypothetical protein